MVIQHFKGKRILFCILFFYVIILIKGRRMKKKVLLCGFLVLLVISTVNASTKAGCAIAAYKDSCSGCSFDEDGKMGSWCYAYYKGLAFTCLTGAYPEVVRAYNKGECPKAEGCKRSFNLCQNLDCTGNDKMDCSTNKCQDCYIKADQCVYEASKDCAGVDDWINYIFRMCLGPAYALPLSLLGFIALFEMPSSFRRLFRFLRVREKD